MLRKMTDEDAITAVVAAVAIAGGVWLLSLALWAPGRAEAPEAPPEAVMLARAADPVCEGPGDFRSRCSSWCGPGATASIVVGYERLTCRCRGAFADRERTCEVPNLRPLAACVWPACPVSCLQCVRLDDHGRFELVPFEVEFEPGVHALDGSAFALNDLRGE